MRKIIILLIAFCPFSGKVRAWLYGRMPDYTIEKNVHIGFGTVINCAKLRIGKDSVLGRLVRVKNIDSFVVGKNSLVNSSCMFCGPVPSLKSFQRDVTIGDFANIQCGHYFDVVAPIEIKDYVTLAGKETQIFTHSFDIEGNRLDGSVEIGNHVYIGSRCIINLGVAIADKVVLQAGTVLNKSLEESGVYTSNILEKRGNIHSYSEMTDYHKDLGQYKCYTKKAE